MVSSKETEVIKVFGSSFLLDYPLDCIDFKRMSGKESLMNISEKQDPEPLSHCIPAPMRQTPDLHVKVLKAFN